MWPVVVCDHETSWYEEAIARAGLHSQRNNKQQLHVSTIYGGHHQAGTYLKHLDLRPKRNCVLIFFLVRLSDDDHIWLKHVADLN
jgi:hypothetical protein